MNDLSEALNKLEGAIDYTDIFPDIASVSTVYRQLAKVVHPDLYSGSNRDLAGEGFRLLTIFKRDADQMIEEGRFGEKVILSVITTRKAKHRVIRKAAEGDLSVLYEAVTTNDGYIAIDSIVKVAKSAKDNDLLTAEAKALKALHATGSKWDRAIPILLDTFMHSEGRRRSNAIVAYPEFYTLTQVRKAYPDGVPALHAAWIWRRLLMALGYAHDEGYIHGAVVPAHVMIEPKNHALILVDWCYSVVIDAQSKTSIKAVVPMADKFYAPEVWAKQPATPATDLYMAARCLRYLANITFPRPLRAYFSGICLEKPSMRPQNAWLLLEEFDELLKAMGKPFYPRKFVEFTMPTGLV
jgi:serine/threonine protein kinase